MEPRLLESFFRWFGYARYPVLYFVYLQRASVGMVMPGTLYDVSFIYRVTPACSPCLAILTKPLIPFFKPCILQYLEYLLYMRVVDCITRSPLQSCMQTDHISPWRLRRVTGSFESSRRLGHRNWEQTQGARQLPTFPLVGTISSPARWQGLLHAFSRVVCI